MAKSLGDERDELYGRPLGEFVAARNELARRLKKEGRAEEAAQVSGLAKPTLPVWVVNQLARRRRREVDLLLDAGHRLRAAHEESKPETARQALENAQKAEREAVRRLAKAAEEILEAEQGRASSGIVDRAVSTLRAAAVTEEARELLARGSLTEELTATGFELAASLTPSRAAGGRGRPGEAAGKRERVAAARAALAEARERERDAAKGLRDAERRAEEARRVVAAAEETLERARAAAEEATAEVEAAAGEVERAKEAE